MNFNFSWDFRDFAIRTNFNKDGSTNKKYPLELVKYDNSHESYFKIAEWKKGNEGYELHLIGSKPFEQITPEEIANIWRQLQAGQKMLDEYFSACQDEEGLEYW